MTIIKRVFLFLLTNILIVTTVSIVVNVLGIGNYLNHQGIDYQTLASVCLIWGMTAAFVSLLLSRWIAKMALGIKPIHIETATNTERQLLDTVHRLANRAGLNTMPQVGVYRSGELNAFATGPSKTRSLIGVSSGLLNKMDSHAMEGVLAHEVTHIVNGDMVTMTLLQGAVNAFSMFLSRIISYTLHRMVWEQRDSKHRTQHAYSKIVYYLTVVFFDIFITLLGSMVVAWFSRHREYRADEGGASLAGRGKMIAALEHLRTAYYGSREVEQQDMFSSFKINRKSNRFLALLATHPDIDLRIKALEGYN